MSADKALKTLGKEPIVSDENRQGPVQRVLVVDEGGAAGFALASWLRASGVVATHIAATELGQRPLAADTSFAILDASMVDEQSAADCVQTLRAYCERVFVALLVTHEAPDGHASLLAMTGADAVVSADIAPSRLMRLLRNPAAQKTLPRMSARGVSRRPSHASAVPGVDRLTSRERQVLMAITDGASTQAMAVQLSISVHTVRTHVQNIFAKLNASSRLELAAIGRVMGSDTELEVAG